MRIVMLQPFGSFEVGDTVAMGREAALAMIRTGRARLWTPEQDGSREQRHPDKSIRRGKARRKTNDGG